MLLLFGFLPCHLAQTFDKELISKSSKAGFYNFLNKANSSRAYTSMPFISRTFTKKKKITCLIMEESFYKKMAQLL